MATTSRTRASILTLAALACALVAPPPLPAADVSVKGVKDTRWTEPWPFAGLEVDLVLGQDVVEDAESYRVSVASATDDTDRNLVDEKKAETSFEPLPQGPITLKLRNPRRRATAIRALDAKVELYVPKHDPSSRVEVQLGGKPRTSIPALAKQKIELAVLNAKQYAEMKKAEDEKRKQQAAGNPVAAMAGMFEGLFSAFTEVDENSVVLQVSDPEGKIVGFHLETADGRKLDSRGGFSSGDVRTRQTRSLNFSEKVPDSAKLVVGVLTPKSLVEVPVKLANVELP